MWNLKNNTNEYIYKTETDRHRKQTNGYQRGWGDKLGVWDQQTQTTIHKIDKEQGPTVQYTEPIIIYNGKESEIDIYIYVDI